MYALLDPQTPGGIIKLDLSMVLLDTCGTQWSKLNSSHATSNYLTIVVQIKVG